MDVQTRYDISRMVDDICSVTIVTIVAK